MADDVLTRNGDGELAVRTVQSTGDNYVNPNDVYTRDNDGKLCVRTVGNGGGGGGAVDSVNGQTGAVVLDAEDVGALPDDTPIPDPQVNSDWNATSGVAEILNKPTIPSTAQQVDAVPQYETMPTASASNLGEVAQYAGVEVPDTPASATITQTVGSGLTDLAVNVATFESGENPSGDTTVDFVANVISGSITVTTVSQFTITCFDPEGFISALQTITSQSRDWVIEQMNSGNGFSYDDSHTSGEIEAWTAGYWLPDGTFEQYFTFDPTLSGICSFTCHYTEGSMTWEKDGVTVDLTNYGITFTGTPANNDTLEVDYSAFVKGWTNGYFYKNEATYTDPSATISQTAGSGLTDLSVDVATFESAEQPTGDETAVFTVASIIPERYLESQEYPSTYCDVSIDATIYRAWCEQHGFNYENVAIKNEYLNEDGHWCIGDAFDDLFWQDVTLEALVDVGITITNVDTSGNTATLFTYQPESAEWEKDEATVDLANYGITFTGTPVVDDELTVVYTAPAVSGYAWNQKNVQPAPETPSAGIDWKTKIDLPADFMSSDWGIYPVFRITGGLPDGEYEMYFQAKKSNGNGNVLGLGTYVFRFSIDNANSQFAGWFEPVIDGNWGGINDRIMPDGNWIYSVFWTDNGDLVIWNNGEAFQTNVHGYFPNTAVPECFKLSAIKNIETGDEYIATGSLYNNDSFQQSWSGNLKCEALQTSPSVPTYYSRIALNTTDATALSISGVAYQSNRFDYVSEVAISLSLGNDVFNATLKVLADSYELTVEDATGVFENTQVGRMPSSWESLYVKFNFPAGTTGTINASAGWKGASKDTGHYINGSTVDNTFVPLNVLKIGVTPASANYLGKIMQYTGTTDANYTNGYFYKATGTVVTTPQSLTTTSVDPADVSVAIDVDNLIPAIQSFTGWSRDSIVGYFASNYEWRVSYDWDNSTVTEVFWGAYGSFTDASILNCFTVSTTGSYTGASNVSFYATYTPETQTISGGAWTRVDVQPSGGGSSLPDQTNKEGMFLQTNGSTAQWSDTRLTHTTTKTFTYDENTMENVLRITPKQNRDCWVRVECWEGNSDGEGGFTKGQQLFTSDLYLSHADLLRQDGNFSSKALITNLSIGNYISFGPCVQAFYDEGGQTVGGFFDIDTFYINEEEIPTGEERYVIMDIKYSDGVDTFTYPETFEGAPLDYSTGMLLPNPTGIKSGYGNVNCIPMAEYGGQDVQWFRYPFGNVFVNSPFDDNAKTLVTQDGDFTLTWASQVREFPTFDNADEYTVLLDPVAIFQYTGETTNDYTQGYFYKIQYDLDRNAVATQTVGSSLTDITVNQAVFADWIKQEWGYVQGTYEFTFDGSNWSGTYGGEYADLTDMGITYTGTPVANDVIEVTFDDATWTWVQVNAQPSVEEVLAQVSGYDATKTQTLKNVNGIYTWVDDPA